MEHTSNLWNLIQGLEFGTNLHIGVIWIEKNLPEQLFVPFSHNIHTSPACCAAKDSPRGLKYCFQCRSLAMKHCVDQLVDCEGPCINGIYEYWHPVLFQDHLTAIVFIGNILPAGEAGQKRFHSRIPQAESFVPMLEQNCPPETCRKIAAILESYICMVLKLAFPAGCFPREQDPSQSSSEIIRKVTTFMDENLSQDFSVSLIAGLVHYNAKYLGRLFKQETGVSMHQYLNARRMEYAASLLTGTRRPVIQIAAQAGFGNVCHFNRVFQKHYACSPTQFRRKSEETPPEKE